MDEPDGHAAGRHRTRSLLDWLARPFAAWLHVVVRRPRLVLAACLLLAAASGWLMATRIGFVADLNAVIGSDHHFNRVFEDYRDTFGEQAGLLVVLHDGHAPRTQALARELADAYRRSGQFESAVPVLPSPNPLWLAREPLPTLREALHRLEPLRDALAQPPEPQALLAKGQAVPPAERTPAQQQALDTLQAALAVVPDGQRLPRPLLWSDVVEPVARDVASGEPARWRRAAAYAALLQAGLADSREAAGVWRVPAFWAWATQQPALDAQAQQQPAVALVVVTPFPESTHLYSAAEAAAAQRLPEREALARFQQIFEDVRLRYPDVAAGLTGRPLLNAQEQAIQRRSSTVAGSLSFAIVLIVVVVFVRRVRLTLSIGAALAVALAWTMGLVALTIGELNVLSSAFAVVLAATGVDFGIHLATAFEHQRRLGRSVTAAIETGFTTIGRGVIAGALTTALGFLATTVAEFQAIAQLGQIAAAGMLLCLLSMFTVLPALLVLTERERAGQPATGRDGRLLPATAARLRTWRPAGGHEATATATATAAGAAAAVAGPAAETPTANMPPAGMPRPVAGLVLLGVAGLAALALTVGQRVGFNYNRLELLDPSVSAISWMRVMDRQSVQSSRFGVVICGSQAEAARVAAAFRERPDIARAVVWLGDLVPPGTAASKAALREWAAGTPSLARRRDEVFRPDLALQRLRQPPVVAADPRARAAGPLHAGVDGSPVTAAELAAQERALKHLMAVLEASVDGERLQATLARLLAALDEPAARAAAELRPLRDVARQWHALLGEGPPEREPVERLAWLRLANLAGAEWETLLRGDLAMLHALAEQLPTHPDELPPAVRRAYLAEDGRWLVQVFSAQDIWEERPGREFIAFGESVHPDFTGPAAQYTRAIDLMQAGLLTAAHLAAVAVFLLLVFDFLPRRLAWLPAGTLAAAFAGLIGLSGWSWDAAVWPAVAVAMLVALPWMYPVVLAALPLATGIALTLGTMALAGQSFNPANIVVLPALLGIGIDIGIHLVHAARQTDGRVRVFVPRVPHGRGPGPRMMPTARAVLLTSVTTVAGFGSLLVAGHAGIRSLGWLFAVAIFWCMLSAYVVLPALTRLRPLRTVKADE